MAQTELDTRPPASAHSTCVCEDESVCLGTQLFAQMCLPPWMAATFLAHSSPGKVSLSQNAGDERIGHTENLPVYTSSF